jgi:hypothetical protein
MHTHRNCALMTIALVNKNSLLTNSLEDSEEKLRAMIAQNLMLQQQLASLTSVPNPSSNICQEPSDDTRMDEDGPNMIQRGGGQGSGSEGPATIHGGGNKCLGSECSDDPPPWGYGAGPTGHILSFEDLLPYQRTRVESCPGGKQGRARTIETSRDICQQYQGCTHTPRMVRICSCGRDTLEVACH